MPSFKIIGLLVLKNNVKVLALCGHGGHLGHVTETIFLINSCPSFKKRLHINSRKNVFENGHIHAFSPRAGVDTPGKLSN